MEEYFFESKKSDNFIKLLKDKDNIIWIEKYNVDNTTYDFILEFCEMIKNAFQTAKNRGGEMHSQFVSKLDWENYLVNDDRWDLLTESDDEIMHIQCDIDDAPLCIIESFLGKQTDNQSDLE
jgi:hypothetical protein